MSLVSSQLLMMVCSTGYLRVKMPRLPWASSPTVAILLLHAHHDAPVSGTTDHGLEHGWGRVIPSKASFTHARVVTDDQWTILLPLRCMESGQKGERREDTPATARRW